MVSENSRDVKPKITHEPGDTSGIKTSKLSKQQKEILDWIAKEMGADNIAATLEEQGQLGLFKKMLVAAGNPAEEIIMHRKRGVKWDARRFLEGQDLDDEAFNRKSTTIARSLKRLEEGGLVKRTQNRGKKLRTSHVKLTKAGFLFWLHLKKLETARNLSNNND